MDASSLVTFLSYGMIITAVATFFTTLYIKAPYGRYSTSKGWGPLLPARFAWFVMEAPNLVCVLIVLLHFSTEACRASQCNNILLGLFSMHYFNRAILYPLRMRRDASPMPVSVCLLAFAYCCWNGATQALSLGVVTPLPASHLYSPQFILGIFIFFSGLAINIHSDHLLMSLRKSDPANKKVGAVRAQYKIPRGGLFEYVSCANYFGEIVEWSGFALACWSIPGLAFALFTFCNIGTRAVHHHQHYLEKFDDYPRSRKAVIPFIW